MTRTTNPTTSSKWIRAPPICKLKPSSHKTSKTTKIVQSMLASRSPKRAEPDETFDLAHKWLHHGVSHFPNLKSDQKSSVWECVLTARTVSRVSLAGDGRNHCETSRSREARRPRLRKDRWKRKEVGVMLRISRVGSSTDTSSRSSFGIAMLTSRPVS